MKTYIYFIRHAESTFVFGKERERPITNKGIIDSEKISEKLSNIKFDHFISSPYKRAIQTIEPLVKNSEIELFEELREKSLKGEFKLDKSSIDEAIKKSFIDIDFKLEGGESTREVQNRAIPLIESIIDDERIKNIAVGTHGNILTSILNYYDQSIGYDFWKSSSKPDIYKCEFHKNILMNIERIE
ncbi:histidine phosphatase family protein [Mammaliicoccus fleurettii]|uniref:histidine phosphatase family protein n=1 Tax=Mammaliicoccus fleurettii TaxID=150056 RepID=UPI0009942ABE|nr:histidine phosphatase family protein [Mammaliicoccus fleurettii]OOV77252.1 hypothetical protein B2G86_06460 [Mammaliicoccus fleurettii]